MASFLSFEDLDCWKEAVILRRKVRALTRTFPSEEKYRLVDQLIRCARSVTANIAEGSGRYHHLENTKFCRISRGSLKETLDHLIVAEEESYITTDELMELRLQVNKCVNILNGYIGYLIKANEKTKPNRLNKLN